MSPARPLVRFLLALVFAGTGFTALTLQVVWQRVIALHGGVDLYSTTTVVAAFLGGFGLGSLAGGGLADRIGARRSVLAYAAANLGIAGFALASPWLLYDLYRRVEPVVEGLLLSFAFHVGLLAVPTLLMGMSLPLLSRGVVRTVDEIGAVVGRLYAVNTLGAAAGAAVSGWWLLGTFGFVGTIRLAALGNVAAACIAGGLGALTRPADPVPPLVAAPAVPAPDPAVPAATDPDRGSSPWPWFGVYALTGAVALGLEIVFFRVVDAFMRSNSYTFAHVLSLYLVLFSVGTAVGSRLVRRAAHPERWFLWLQWAAGAGALLGMALLLAPLRLPHFAGVRTSFEHYLATDGLATGFGLSRQQLAFATVLAPLVVMTIPVVCFGAAYPFIQATVARRLDVLGRRTGALLFANVVGNVAGTLITGFVLLDLLGSSGTLKLFGALLIAPGIAAALRAAPRRRPILLAAAIGTVAALLVAVPSNRDVWAKLHSAEHDGFAVVEERACVNALARRGEAQLLYVNGASQNSHPYDDFHVLIGLLPALVHDEPDDGLAIGLGMGGTTFGLAMDPRLERVDTVEICGGQVELIEHLAVAEGSVPSAEILADPRIRIRVGDGRKALLQEDRRALDIVVVDTLRPQSGYSGNLYSREFYELVRGRLRPGGLFVQWLATSRTLDTMQEAFPHLLVFAVPNYHGSQFVIASDQPIDFDRDELLGRFDRLDDVDLVGPLGPALRDFAATVQPRVLAGGRTIVDERRNEDLFPRDEYWLNNGL